MKKILIVDDDPDIRDSLQEFLEDSGYTVDAAKNGEEGLEQLRQGDPPCAVILDLLMPILDGNAMYAAMQLVPYLASVPVIVTTSDPSRAPSGVPIMKKPINLTTLLAAIKRHCPSSA